MMLPRLKITCSEIRLSLLAMITPTLILLMFLQFKKSVLEVYLLVLHLHSHYLPYHLRQPVLASVGACSKLWQNQSIVEQPMSRILPMHCNDFLCT